MIAWGRRPAYGSARGRAPAAATTRACLALWAAAALLTAGAAPAFAAPPGVRGPAGGDAPLEVPDPEVEPELPGDDAAFGPLVEIERIAVVGNARTHDDVIRRALALRPGDRLHSGDPRFRASRFRVLALGYFSDVRLRLDRGSRRGAIVLTVEVVERGTLTLHRIYLGQSAATPLWAGLDVGEANLAGTGVGLGLAGAWAARAAVPGAEPQLALRLRVGRDHVLGSRLGVHGTLLYNDASDPVPDDPAQADDDPARFRAARSRRLGAVAGMTWGLTRRSTGLLDLRVERVTTEGALPAGAHLEPGTSRVVTLAAGLGRDTRPDPILPYAGDRLELGIEAALEPLGSTDGYVIVRARYGRWQTIQPRHVLSLHLGAGLIVGEAPRFDRFHVGDVNPLLPPRVLDLVVSTRSSPDFLGTGIDAVRTGTRTLGGAVEYAYRLFRRPRAVYGGDVFVAVGAFGLADPDAPDGTGAFPVDLFANAGLRLDTEIGVFELSLGNGLGRIPF